MCEFLSTFLSSQNSILRIWCKFTFRSSLTTPDIFSTPLTHHWQRFCRLRLFRQGRRQILRRIFVMSWFWFLSVQLRSSSCWWWQYARCANALHQLLRGRPWQRATKPTPPQDLTGSTMLKLPRVPEVSWMQIVRASSSFVKYYPLFFILSHLILSYPILCYLILYYIILSCVLWCSLMLYDVFSILFYPILSYALLYFLIFCDAFISFLILLHLMFMLCYAILCYFILSYLTLPSVFTSSLVFSFRVSLFLFVSPVAFVLMVSYILSLCIVPYRGFSSGSVCSVCIPLFSTRSCPDILDTIFCYSLLLRAFHGALPSRYVRVIVTLLFVSCVSPCVPVSSHSRSRVLASSFSLLCLIVGQLPL